LGHFATGRFWLARIWIGIFGFFLVFGEISKLNSRFYIPG
jgi:hypothetical protein